ncbi:MAG: hypothetical protein GX887_04560 [Firmicutes bacterium]|nr:hypothetical protein [Bacillota bacterium]
MKGPGEMNFISPSKGRLSFDDTFAELTTYVNESYEENYKLIIGTDSHAYINDKVVFVTAIVIHRVGKGGRYFFHKRRHRYMESMRQRIFYETLLSLEVASRLTDKLLQNGFSELNIEIHLDVGEKGETREIIKEVVGMVIGSGYDARIKPDSYGASKVADRYTK